MEEIRLGLRIGTRRGVVRNKFSIAGSGKLLRVDAELFHAR
jgi:hypothetical protein